jgi:WD40 repeat protein
MYHKVAIESYPLQTYASALLFSPTGSLTRKLFQHEEPTDITIKPDMSNSWSPCLQTLEGLGKPVFTVALSQDSTQLASVSSNGIVKIWEPSSGACLETFDLLDTPAGQEKNCYRFEFSHDLKWVAFACKRDVGEDRVEVWDTDSRARVLTFKNFNARNTVDLYFDMAFSHHSTWLALASKSGTFRVWDTSNFTLLQRLDNYNCSYRSLAFSQDSVWLALWSYDGTIEILDTSSYMCLQTFQSSLRSVGLLAFSHDSTKLAYGGTYYNRTNIWDLSSGAVSQTFKHSDPVTALAFSRNSAWLAVGHGNGTITMYDTHSGVCLQILEGHREYVFSLAFCHDSSWLASSSIDETVKIWDTASIGACLRAPKRQSSDVMKVVFSYDLTRLASISTDGTVKIWDAASGTCLQQFAGHSKSVNDVAFSYDSRWLASAGHDCTVKIWDIASNGTCLYTLEGHSKYVAVVKFSKDSTRIASISNDETVKIWDTVSGVCLQTLGRCYRYYLHSLAFSYDNNLLASSAAHQQSRSTVKIWDVSSGKCLHILEDDLFSVSSITFSHDTTQLATVMPWFGQKNSKGITVKIWDVSSGTCPQSFQISIGSDWPPELLSFDQSKSCLYTDIGTIDLHSLENPTLRRFLSAGLTTHGPWIKHSGDNLLWVPSEYRGYRMSTRGSKMVIVDGLGKIWFYSTNR